MRSARLPPTGVDLCGRQQHRNVGKSGVNINARFRRQNRDPIAQHGGFGLAFSLDDAASADRDHQAHNQSRPHN
jgi:hypothetical protein